MASMEEKIPTAHGCASDGTSTTTLGPDSMGPDTPITYHYLTHETRLPAPSLAASRSASPSAAVPPSPPDLSPFASPFHWSPFRKNLTLSICLVATLVTAYTAGSYALGTVPMAQEWEVSTVAVTVGITTFTTGFAIAPMVLAPFSEINGRKPVMVATGILFVVCQVCCAVTRSYGGMVAARFFAGAGSSTFSTLVGGVISDVYHAEERNTPMALFAGAALAGTGLGPLCSGFVVAGWNWRGIFWVQVGSCGAVIAVVTLFFKETRGSVLVTRMADKLNLWYEEREEKGWYGVEMTGADGEKRRSERIRWKVKAAEERASLATMIGISLYRPFREWIDGCGCGRGRCVLTVSM
jgi:multidrug resistance protein